jgi:mxaL protein
MGLLLAIAGLLAVAIYGPQMRVTRNVFDYLFVLDITQSMNTEDYFVSGKPISRLAFVKQTLHHSLHELPCGSTVGWAIFTEYRTFLLLNPIEVCANYTELSTSLDRIDGRMAWAGGSELRKGVNWGLKLVKEMQRAPTIVFVTDGHEAPPVNPKLLPRLDLAAGSVLGLLVGVGGDALAPIPKLDPQGKRIGYWKADEVLQMDIYSLARRNAGGAKTGAEERPASYTGTEHLSSLKQSYLLGLARDTGLGYHRLVDTEALGTTLRGAQFARPGPTQLGLAWIPASGALLALAGSYLVPWRRRTSPMER